jgi:transposase
MRYELSNYEWTAIKPMLPDRPRGVRRVNDRRVLNGIFWVLRSGAPWQGTLAKCQFGNTPIASFTARPPRVRSEDGTAPPPITRI